MADRIKLELYEAHYETVGEEHALISSIDGATLSHILNGIDSSGKFSLSGKSRKIVGLTFYDPCNFGSDRSAHLDWAKFAELGKPEVIFQRAEYDLSNEKSSFLDGRYKASLHNMRFFGAPAGLP